MDTCGPLWSFHFSPVVWSCRRLIRQGPCPNLWCGRRLNKARRRHGSGRGHGEGKGSGSYGGSHRTCSRRSDESMTHTNSGGKVEMTTPPTNHSSPKQTKPQSWDTNINETSPILPGLLPSNAQGFHIFSNSVHTPRGASFPCQISQERRTDLSDARRMLCDGHFRSTGVNNDG